uniref:Uncharacterized protein n=1 Tax=Oryza nivara TaxID=4536 RepID=A0A0E0GMY2_ORYNI
MAADQEGEERNEDSGRGEQRERSGTRRVWLDGVLKEANKLITSLWLGLAGRVTDRLTNFNLGLTIQGGRPRLVVYNI